MGPYVIFQCGGIRCALARADVQRIVPLPALSRPPTLPPIMAGIANLAGVALPVIDATTLFALTSDETVDPLYRHILVMRLSDAQTLGLLVDRVLDVRAIETGAEIDPTSSLNGCVDAMSMHGGEPLHVLSNARILTAAERARLAEIHATEQARLETWGAA